MISVKLDYTFFYQNRVYGRELCVWTEETNYTYYPLSYSIQVCLELICESLGWEYKQYKIFDDSFGILYAMKPEPKKLSLWWDKSDYTIVSSTATCLYLET